MGKLSLFLIAVGSVMFAVSMGHLLFSGIRDLWKTDEERTNSPAPSLPDDDSPWNRLKGLSTPYFMTIRVFHTLNPDQVSVGKKPVLEERGPYVYEAKRVNLELKFNEQNETMTYRTQVQYFFRPDMSNGTEEDYVTVLNMPLAMLAMNSTKLAPEAQRSIQTVIQRHEDQELLFWNITIRELLFAGRYVPMLKALQDESGHDAFQLKNYTFGVFFPKNGSDEGAIEVKTGVTNSNEFGHVVSWRDRTEFTFWNGTNCDAINATDGSLFAPFVKTGRKIYVFSPDLCRSLYLTYTEDTELKGIKGYRFGVPRAALAGPVENKANECFCLEPATDYNNCLGAGAIQLSACRNGAPIVMSTPHFFDGDQQYIDAAIGLKPDKEKHQTFIELEPNTGLMLKAHKRIQVNVQIAPNTISAHYSDVPNMLFPILWADEKAEMSDATAEGLKNLVLKKVNMVETGKWILLGVGIVVVLAGIILLIVSKNSHDQRTKYSPANTHDKAHEKAQEMKSYEVPLK